MHSGCRWATLAVVMTVSPVLDQAPERVGQLIPLLQERYPDTKIPLRHGDPFQLVIATILSAQCTDEMVNQVTPVLFERFPDPPALAEAPLQELEKILYPTGFFRQKAKAVKETAAIIRDRYGGEVPRRMEDLTTLPGVGRKTANVILAASRIQGWPGWADPDDGMGMVVDTHVRRLARRLGLTAAQDPERIEKDLKQLVDKEHWPTFPLHLIFFGREICNARKPRCGDCPAAGFCPAAAYQGQTPWLNQASS